MTSRLATAGLAGILCLGLLGVAASCGGPEAPTPSPTRSATPSSSGTASASATPTASPTAEAAPPFVIACDTIVPASRLDFFATSGLSLFPPADFFAKVAAEAQPSPYNLFQANAGVVCPWENGSEIVWAYGATPLPPGQSAEMKSLITGSDPFTESSYAGGTLYTSQVEGSAFQLFLVVETAAYVATTQEILDELLLTIP